MLCNKKLLVIGFVGALVCQQQSVRACGSNFDWMTQFIQTQQEIIEYVSIEGKELFADIVRATISSMIQMYAENPQSFMQFINLCFENSTSPVPGEILNWLKKFNFVQPDATISDVIKLIVNMVIEPKADGTIEFWSIDRLAKDGWIEVTKKRTV